MADLQSKLKKRLEAILKLPENMVCADCRKRGPRWASANLGIFICIECSGIHRNLGVHISFVRSVNLDSWTPAQVEYMEEWGNKRANEYYEANLPAHVVRPKEGDAVRVVERFIRDKYEHKRYIGKIPPKHSELSTEPQQEPVPRKTTTAAVTQRTPTVTQKPSQAPAPVQAPSLLDFDEPVPAPIVPPASASSVPFDPFAPTPSGSHDFGVFTSAPAHAPPPVPHQNDFGDFTSAQSAPQGWGAPHGSGSAATLPSSVPPKPQASADAILSLYSTSNNRSGMAMGPGVMQQPTHMGMNPPMMGMGYGQPPQNPFQPSQQHGNFPVQQGHYAPQQPQQHYGMHPGMHPAQGHSGIQQPFGQPGFGQQQPPVNPFTPRPVMNGMPMQNGQMMGMSQNNVYQQPPHGYPGHVNPQQPLASVNQYGQQQAPQQQNQSNPQQHAFSQLSWPTH